MKNFVYYSGSDAHELEKWLLRYLPNRYPYLRKKMVDFGGYCKHELKILQEHSENFLTVIKNKGKFIGFTIFINLPLDSQIFGIKMGKVGFIFTEHLSYDEESKIKRNLVNTIIEYAESKNVYHLSCRLDVDDLSGIHILEEHGFKLMDTIVTYLFPKGKKNLTSLRSFYKTRYAKESDLPILTCLAGRSFKLDRFHNDSNLCSEKANILFVNWLRNYFEDKMTCKVIVAEKTNKTPVGFLAYKLNKPVWESTGYKIIGEGLSAVSSEAKGAYISLVKRTLQDTISYYDYAEFDTQINNYEVINILQKFGLVFVRARDTFHKCLKASK